MSTLKAEWKPNFSPYEGPESTEGFNRAFSNHGGHSQFRCNCGRTWFNSTQWGWGETELQSLREGIAEGRTVETDYSIEEIMGFVIGCPCNQLRRYEDWVWTNRERILDYLKVRNAGELREAMSLQNQCNQAEGHKP